MFNVSLKELESMLYNYRNCFFVALFNEGHSVEEICEVSGLSKNTIKRILNTIKISDWSSIISTTFLTYWGNRHLTNLNSVHPECFYSTGNIYKKEFRSVIANEEICFLGRKEPKYVYSVDYCFKNDDIKLRYYGLCKFSYNLYRKSYIYNKYSSDEKFKEYYAKSPDKITYDFVCYVREQESLLSEWNSIIDKKIEQIFNIDSKELSDIVVYSDNNIIFCGDKQTFIFYPFEFYMKKFRDWL